MQIKEKTKEEIEKKANGMSAFLKIEYLEECLKQRPSFEIMKYCDAELAKIYEDRKMFAEAAKRMENAAEISVSFREKNQAYMKAVELYIKATAYEKAEYTFKKSNENVSTSERKAMKDAVKKLLKQQAEIYEKENRRGQATRAYEELLRLSEDNEKPAIKEKLMSLYLLLGKIREYNALKGKA